MDFRNRNTKSFSAFCRDLGTPLNNVNWSWSARNPDLKRAVFTIWADRVVDGAIVLWEPDSPRATRNGGKELKAIADEAVAGGYEAFGILCYVVDANASPRVRGYYADDVLLVLRLTSTADQVVAHIVGEVSSNVAPGQTRAQTVPMMRALDDISEPPLGNAVPERIVQLGSGYRRDARVRAYIVQQANGRCEYCTEHGFTLPDGRRYLEAHHILALSAWGPDTVDNVVALCANHHREAHFGGNALQLNEKLATLPARRLGAAQ